MLFRDKKVKTSLFSDLNIGGINPNPEMDTQGPIIELFWIMNRLKVGYDGQQPDFNRKIFR